MGVLHVSKQTYTCHAQGTTVCPSTLYIVHGTTVCSCTCYKVVCTLDQKVGVWTGEVPGT